MADEKIATMAAVRPMKVELHGVTTEYQFKKLFKINKYSTSHEKYAATPETAGQMQVFDWLVFERGDAVAVVLYKTDTKEVILVRQFRAPTLRLDSRTGQSLREDGSLNDGQLDETIAGMPQGRETLEDAAVRETYEETGYRIQVNRLEPIAQFYVSPGGTSEKIFLYYTEVTEENRDQTRSRVLGGKASEKESILIRHIPVSQFFEDFDPRVTVDSKVLIARMLLRERLDKSIPDAARQPAKPGRRMYRMRSRPDCQVIIRTGDLVQIKDVDAWINSENTDMEMDRFIGKSVSALIRHRGALKDEKGRVIEDTIADALKSAMRGAFQSHIGTVHDTTSGELERLNHVKRLFHVAAVEGAFGQGATAVPANIAKVTTGALAAVERRNNKFMRKSCASALLPMIGTGDGGLKSDVSFPLILKGIAEFFEDRPKSILKSVHVAAYTVHDARVAMDELDGHPDFIEIADTV